MGKPSAVESCRNRRRQCCSHLGTAQPELSCQERPHQNTHYHQPAVDRLQLRMHWHNAEKLF